MKIVNKPFLVRLVLGIVVASTAACGLTSSKPRLAALGIDATPAQRAFHAGMEAGYNDMWKQASEHFAEAIELDPNDPKAKVNYGIALERSGELKMASTAYRDVFAADPENKDAARNLVRTLMAVGEHDEARAVIEGALESEPENPDLLNSLSGILRQLKRYDEAAVTARKVILRDQKNAAAIKNLALIYADSDKLQLAETFFLNALKLDEKDSSIRVNLGLIANRRDNHQRAIVEFEKALAINPKSAVAFMNIGAIRLRFRDYARAEVAFKSAIDSGMLNCTTSAALGYSLEGQAEKGEDAVEQLGKAYELCPKEVELLFTMGDICMNRLRDDACALKYFSQYVDANPALAQEHPVHQNIEILKEQMAEASEPLPAADQDSSAPASEVNPNNKDMSAETSTDSEGSDSAGSVEAPSASAAEVLKRFWGNSWIVGKTLRLT